ncbi:MAG: hypothetical protein WEE36_09275 [Acidimicrobiia bacterium]
MSRVTEAEAVRRAAQGLRPPERYIQGVLRPLDEEATGRLQAVLDMPPAPPGWPQMNEDAFFGLAGDLVRTIEPHTESDPVAVLVDFLTSFGNAVGPLPHMRADGADHPARLSYVLVGRTSKSRKGTSRANVARVMQYADPEWADRCQIGGLSSGEGLIQSLSDTVNQEPRRLVVETEFSRVLTAASRQGNILSPVLRQVWDGSQLGVVTRQERLHVARHHVSVIGHITGDELRRTLPSIEIANGFANRFLFFVVDRSKLLPDGGSLRDSDYERLGRRVGDSLVAAREISGMRRSPDAAELWHEMYRELSDPLLGVVGALTARAEAQILRLSVVNALLDGSDTIEPAHLGAARAVWDYSSASVEWLFGEATGSPTADRLLEAIRAAGPRGLTATEQQRALSGHISGGDRREAIELLENLGVVVSEREPTPGAPRTRSYSADFAPGRLRSKRSKRS